MVENGALSHKIDYITIFEDILNLEGNLNCTTGSRVAAILLNAWIFPIGQSGGASRLRLCYQRGLPRLVYEYSDNTFRANICSKICFLIVDTFVFVFITFLFLRKATKEKEQNTHRLIKRNVPSFIEICPGLFRLCI